ncbi:hypothetical protein BC008_05985 [Mastigocoleus testarum BC008]|uniref:Uncharacterized protein n=1 Tax=Mastigocoleus testarum BC008 TaxID=371196 RepID=A0A0V8A055_9CYAN|nr:hypothetical protein BC008_05985 [Mastigocoleus testarum BC008]
MGRNSSVWLSLLCIIIFYLELKYFNEPKSFKAEYSEARNFEARDFEARNFEAKNFEAKNFETRSYEFKRTEA